MSERSLKPGWKIVKFGDVVHLNTEKVADPLASGIERYVGLEHLTPEDLHIHTWGQVAEGTTFTNYFKPGQVLFGKRRAYQHKVAVAEFEGVCSGDIYVFEPLDPAVLLPELLPFVCQTEGFYEYAVGTSAGSLSPRTNWSQLANYEFPLPPLDEQRRVAEVLWAADQVAEEWREALDSLEKIKLSLSYKLFAENGEAEQIRCDALCKEITVGIVVTPAKYYVPKGVPALRSLNVFPDKFVLDELVYISEEANNIYTKSSLSAGDVVVVRTGRPGDAAVINSELDGCNCIDLIIIRPGEQITPNYLSRFINSSAGRRIIARGTAGSAQLHFNVGEMKKMLIPLVSIKRQNEIVNELSMVDEQIRQIKNHIFQSNQIKGTFIGHLVTD